jgi:hypothetical protein
LSFTEKRRRCWSVVRCRWCMSSGKSSTSFVINSQSRLARDSSAWQVPRVL